MSPSSRSILATTGPGVRVRDLMTTKVFTIRSDKRLLAVQEIMKWANVRHIPVVDAKGMLVGIVSQRDLLASAVSTLAVRIADAERQQHLASLNVDALMRREVVTIGPDASIQLAAHQMRARRIGCLPVVEEGRLIGMLTESDMLALIEQIPEASLDQAGPPIRPA